MKGGVRERSKGKWSYYFKYKDEFEKWKSKEKSGFHSKKEAESALRKAITDFEDDGYLTKKTVYTLEQYIDYWFEHVADLKLQYNTIVNYRCTSKNHIINEIGHINIDKITLIVIQKFMTKKSQSCYKGTIDQIKKVLNGVFSLAVKQRIIKHNPLQSLENTNVKQEETETRFLNKEEVDRIIAASSNSKYYLPILIAINTGLRRGEVLGLTWDDIDFHNRTITVNKQLQYHNNELLLTQPKTKTSNRIIVIPSFLATKLEEAKLSQNEYTLYYAENYYTENNFVCCDDDGSPFKPYELTNYTSRLSKALDIPLKFHNLRHTHATLLLEADVNVKVIQERLGHSNINTTLNVYSHVTKELEFASMDKFEKLIATKNK